jgi:hypothetical protein
MKKVPAAGVMLTMLQSFRLFSTMWPLTCKVSRTDVKGMASIWSGFNRQGNHSEFGKVIEVLQMDYTKRKGECGHKDIRKKTISKFLVSKTSGNVRVRPSVIWGTMVSELIRIKSVHSFWHLRDISFIKCRLWAWNLINLIKSKSENILEIHHLDNLMRIK